MLENVIIYVDDVPYDRWQNLTVRYSLDSIVSEATFSAPDNPRVGITEWLPQTKIRIASNGEDLFNGTLQKNEINISRNRVSTTLTARSFSSVLSDSSPPMNGENAPINIQGSSLQNFLKILIEPYGIIPEIQGTVPPNSLIKYSQINPLSTVERELKNALLSMSGTTGTAKKDGSFKIIVNAEYEEFSNQISNSVKELNVSSDDSKRFHKYEAISTTNVRLNSNTPITGKSSVIDELVKDEKRIIRKRVPGSSTGFTEKYANWMKNVSFAKSRKLDVTLVGWRPIGRDFQDNFTAISGIDFFMPGQVHRINSKARIFERAHVEGEWLIESVIFQRKNATSVNENTGGTTCNISFIRPEAFINEPVEFKDPLTTIDSN